ncbi:MAG TPA: T9SS type A sorting domain-containing protein, partial [Bacteroidia bacterium]|nr:T9SS type A sorting domain-containing protein [Bacteroidia bacterium]
IYNSSAIADSAYIQFIEETSAHSTVGVNAGTYVILDDLNFIGTVGVQSFSANNLNVQVSPNPSGGLFSITTGKALEDNTEFKVMSVTGKEVFTVKAKDILTNSNYTLDLSNCAAGVYFAHIRSGDATEVKKLVVFQ